MQQLLGTNTGGNWSCESEGWPSSAWSACHWKLEALLCWGPRDTSARWAALSHMPTQTPLGDEEPGKRGQAGVHLRGGGQERAAPFVGRGSPKPSGTRTAQRATVCSHQSSSLGTHGGARLSGISSAGPMTPPVYPPETVWAALRAPGGPSSPTPIQDPGCPSPLQPHHLPFLPEGKARAPPAQEAWAGIWLLLHPSRGLDAESSWD